MFVLAAAAVATFAWWRSPPKALVRLDSGSDNGVFTLFDDDRRLFYAKRGHAHDIVASVDLSTGKKSSRRLWGRRLKNVGISGSRLQLIADNGDLSPKETRYTIMSVNGDDWSTRLEEPRAHVNPDELLYFDTPYTSSTEAAKVPNINDSYSLSARRVPGGVDVRLIIEDKYGPAKLYATPSEPASVIYTSAESIAVAYLSGLGKSTIEEIKPFTGMRRVIVELEGEVTSIGNAGVDGLIAVRAVPGGTRLSFVSLSQSKQLLDLEWSKGGSAILGADPARKTLYFSMAVKDPDGGTQETGWSVPTDHASLREAAKFFSAMHAWPELRWKLIGHSVEILIGFFLLAAGLFFLGTIIDM